jgi:cytochrome c oxidase cbb3-type subunit 1
MIGSTLRGVEWMEGKPFIDTVANMAPYWVWRAIGGSLMWASHLIFAYNLYTMVKKSEDTDIQTALFNQLKKEDNTKI